MAELNMLENAEVVAKIAPDSKPFYEAAKAYDDIITAIEHLAGGKDSKSEYHTVITDATRKALLASDSAIRQCLKAAARHLNPRKARTNAGA